MHARIRWSSTETRRRIAVLLSLLATLGAAPAAPRKPFAVPRDRAAWESRRAEVRATVFQAIDLPEKPEELVSEGHRTEGPIPGSTLEALAIRGASGRSVRASLFLPAGATRDRPASAIVFLASPGPRGPNSPLAIGPDGTRPVDTLLRRGFAVLVPEPAPSDPPPWVEETVRPPGWRSWGETVGRDRLALGAILARSDIDPKRVGVAGIGQAGMRAWWLTALDERVACCVAVGGLTRLTDWERVTGGSEPRFAPWAKRLLESFDTEAVIALCAPRHLQIMGGDQDWHAPESGFKVLRDTARSAYDMLGSPAFSQTLFGDLGATFTLLEWDGLLETFDKEFLPQGPTPLGHPPEPEPTIDERFINPAEHGIAGWVPEMSQRPGTWTWREGVITCRPGAFEYGWLRMPVELDDFVLQLEWRVPSGGNSGVFLRAKAVPWHFPPSEKSKERVSTRGLDWPSRTGLELQAQDDPGHADKYSSGSLYRHAAPAANPTRPPGVWNRYTVRARGPRIEVWCNGQQILDSTIDRFPTLRKPPMRGFVGLQNHGVSAEFRNIRYLRLGTGTTPTP